jgi:hypothetical protein
MQQLANNGPAVSAEEFARLFRQVSNWGRWGPTTSAGH